MKQPLDHINILLCDDEETNRFIAEAILESVGATVTQTENGRQAVNAVRDAEHAFDLILMDMQMPVLDGYLATRAIRERGFEGPILALTAYTTPGEKAKCIEAGCSGFLNKPLKHKVFLQSAIDAVHRNERGADPLQTAPHSLLFSPEPPNAAPDPPCSVAPLGIHSTLPTDQPRFRWVVETFVEKLGTRMEAMKVSIDQECAPSLAKHAHWLKGAGGTVGFDCFTQPARDMEQYASAGEFGLARASLDNIRTLGRHLALPWKNPAPGMSDQKFSPHGNEVAQQAPLPPNAVNPRYHHPVPSGRSL